jgi:hypothetical protein
MGSGGGILHRRVGGGFLARFFIRSRPACRTVRSDEQTLDGWDGAAPIHRDVPRWEVRREDGQDWDTATVKVDRRADFLLAQGMTLEDVKNLLGRSSITLTSNTYGHVLEQRQRQVAQAMDMVLGG